MAKKNAKMSVKAKKSLQQIIVKNADGDPDTVANVLVQNKIQYTPKISVIIPVYNVEKYLRECLDSVVNQTLKEIEIICIDDGSTDNSLEILKEYAQNDNRITVLHQNNSGSGIARNCGLNIGNGKFVAFMDPDDMYPNTDTLKHMYEAAITNKVLICGGSLSQLRQDGLVTDSKQFEPGYSFSKNGIVEYTDYQFDYGYWRFIYDRKFLVKNNIRFPDFIRQQDPVFFIKAMALSERFYALSEATYVYRVSHKEITWNERKSKDVFTSLLVCLKLCEKYNLDKLFDKIVARFNAWTFRTALAQTLKYPSVINIFKSLYDYICSHVPIDNIPMDDLYRNVVSSNRDNTIVSVIVPCYNVEKYIAKCLDSIINQTLPNIEIICVNDGATDDTQKILEQYAQLDSRIRIINQKNAGLSGARNTGIKEARCNLIYFIDSDDWIEPETLEWCVAKMHGDIDIVSFGATLVNDDMDDKYNGFVVGNEYHRIKIVGQRVMNDDVILQSTYTVWNKLFKKSILDKYDIKFTEGRLFEDNDFTIIYMLHCRNGVFLDQYLYNYVQRSGSIMETIRAGKSERVIDNLYIFDNLYQHCRKYNILNEHKRILSSRYNIHLRSAYKNAPAHIKPKVRQLASEFAKDYEESVFLFPKDIIKDLRHEQYHKIPVLLDVIVSLTSYPARIGTVNQTIETLLNQTKKADRVILWLAPEQFPNREKDLPKQLLELCDKGLTIDWYHDIRSYKKLIPTLKKYPDALIVTADDDLLYEEKWLEELYNGYLKHPDDINIHRATKFYRDTTGFKTIAGGREYWPNASVLNKITGGAGALYPPKCFYKDVLDEDLIMKLAPTNDDQWFWVQCLLNGKKIRVVDNPLYILHYVPGTQETGLCKINDAGPRLFWHDFRVLMNYYPQIYKLLKTEADRKRLNHRFDVPYYSDFCKWYGAKLFDRDTIFFAPKTFNEKIQWLKLFASTPDKTRLADKYLVRDWVAEKIGKKYLIPLLGVYDSFDEINLKKLPKQFVIKCNHGCGYNIIVKNKSAMDLEEIKTKLNKWMDESFAFRAGCELHYRDIKPKIIIEKYIENKKSVGGDLYDYKFWCFNGRVHYIQFLSERNTDGLKMAFYDRKWRKQKFVYSHPLDTKTIDRPDNLDQMIKLAEKLSAGYNHVRVDFYRMDDGTIYFGEMTFTSASGICVWNDEKINRYFGKLIKLPKLAYNVDTGEYYKLSKKKTIKKEGKRIQIKPYLLFPYYLVVMLFMKIILLPLKKWRLARRHLFEMANDYKDLKKQVAELKGGVVETKKSIKQFVEKNN